MLSSSATLPESEKDAKEMVRAALLRAQRYSRCEHQQLHRAEMRRIEYWPAVYRQEMLAALRQDPFGVHVFRFRCGAVAYFQGGCLVCHIDTPEHSVDDSCARATHLFAVFRHNRRGKQRCAVFDKESAAVAYVSQLRRLDIVTPANSSHSYAAGVGEGATGTFASIPDTTRYSVRAPHNFVCVCALLATPGAACPSCRPR